MGAVRKVSLFRDGRRNQALRVPHEFELPDKTALMHQIGPQPAQTLARLFTGRADLDEPFFHIEDEPIPLDE